MKWEFIGLGLALVGVGLTVMLAVPPPWWPRMPSNLIHVGVLGGLLFAIVGCAVALVGLFPELQTFPGPPLFFFIGLALMITGVAWHVIHSKGPVGSKVSVSDKNQVAMTASPVPTSTLPHSAELALPEQAGVNKVPKVSAVLPTTNQRPQISAWIELISPITYDETGIKMSVVMCIKNTGDAPATAVNAFADPKLLAITNDNHPEDVISAIPLSAEWGPTVPVGQELRQAWTLSLAANQIAQNGFGKRTKKEPFSRGSETAISLGITGVVTYSAPNSDAVYSAPYAYEVLRNTVPQLIPKVGPDIPASDLHLEAWPLPSRLTR